MLAVGTANIDEYRVVDDEILHIAMNRLRFCGYSNIYRTSRTNVCM